MLAGPNGGGKSTFWEAFLSESPLQFLNADVLSVRTGLDSLDAARFLDARRAQLVDEGTSFITETVFSDPYGVKLELLQKAVQAGYDVILVYIGIEPALSALRIEQRVLLGGHDVPREKLAGRFARSLENLEQALRFVPLVKIYDNSSVEAPYRLLATFENGKRTFVASTIPPWARGVLKRPARKRSRPRR